MTSTDSPAEATYGDAAASAVAVRRFANDEIARLASRFDEYGSTSFEFLCECGKLGCRGLVTLTLADYHERAPGSVLAHSSS
jgi:hypothetical protein